MSYVTLDDEVREQVMATLSGAQSTEALEEWMAANTWDERTAMVAHVDHVLAERELLDADEVHAELWRAVSTIELDQRQFGTAAVAKTSTVTATFRRAIEWRRNRTFTGQLAGS